MRKLVYSGRIDVGLVHVIRVGGAEVESDLREVIRVFLRRVGYCDFLQGYLLQCADREFEGCARYIRNAQIQIELVTRIYE